MPDWLAQSALGWAPRLLQSAWRRLTGWAERPRLVIGHRVERLPVFTVEVPQDALTPLPPNAANPTGYRMADLAFITITNDADRP